jgi:hypothetical protein
MSDEEIRAIKAKVQQQNRDARASAAALASSDETEEEEEEEDEIEDAVLTWKERLLETLLTMKPDSFDFARIWICQS